jgi:hypothetical protein
VSDNYFSALRITPQARRFFTGKSWTRPVSSSAMRSG